MTTPRNAAVIGLGLIGGSVARALADSGVSVLGFDVNAESSEAARRCGVLSKVLDTSLDGLNEAEWIIISVPVNAAPKLLRMVAERAPEARLITDTGSTKRTIMSAAVQLGLGDRFVGAHPMAGSERSGWTASRADLFKGATTYLCAPIGSASSPCATSAIEAAENLWTLLGARTERITAERHDEKMGAISHLPHVLSTGLAVALDDLRVRPDELGPGGRDMVRIASGDDALWQAILLDNADGVLRATDALLAKLTSFRMALADGEAETVRSFLARGRAWTSTPR